MASVILPDTAAARAAGAASVPSGARSIVRRESIAAYVTIWNRGCEGFEDLWSGDVRARLRRSGDRASVAIQLPRRAAAAVGRRGVARRAYLRPRPRFEDQPDRAAARSHSRRAAPERDAGDARAAARALRGWTRAHARV